VADPYTHANSRQAKISRFLNPSSFTAPGFTAPGSDPYGNEQRNQLVGPGTVNTNLSLFKEFVLRRELHFQFRAESFNVFGNVNLGTPRTNASVLSGLTTSQAQITGAADPRRIQFAAKLLF
jgi:hypothetical protein